MSKFDNGMEASLLRIDWDLRWAFHFKKQWSALVNGEYVSLCFFRCIAVFLNAAIPWDWMDRSHTGSLIISSTQGLSSLCVCLFQSLSIFDIQNPPKLSKHCYKGFTVWWFVTFFLWLKQITYGGVLMPNISWLCKTSGPSIRMKYLELPKDSTGHICAVFRLHISEAPQKQLST